MSPILTAGMVSGGESCHAGSVEFTYSGSDAEDKIKICVCLCLL